MIPGECLAYELHCILVRQRRDRGRGRTWTASPFAEGRNDGPGSYNAVIRNLGAVLDDCECALYLPRQYATRRTIRTTYNDTIVPNLDSIPHTRCLEDRPCSDGHVVPNLGRIVGEHPVQSKTCSAGVHLAKSAHSPFVRLARWSHDATLPKDAVLAHSEHNSPSCATQVSPEDARGLEDGLASEDDVLGPAHGRLARDLVARVRLDVAGFGWCGSHASSRWVARDASEEEASATFAFEEEDVSCSRTPLLVRRSVARAGYLTPPCCRSPRCVTPSSHQRV